MREQEASEKAAENKAVPSIPSAVSNTCIGNNVTPSTIPGSKKKVKAKDNVKNAHISCSNKRIKHENMARAHIKATTLYKEAKDDPEGNE